jgi:hypothetical protein
MGKMGENKLLILYGAVDRNCLLYIKLLKY